MCVCMQSGDTQRAPEHRSLLASRCSAKIVSFSHVNGHILLRMRSADTVGIGVWAGRIYGEESPCGVPGVERLYLPTLPTNCGDG